MDDLEYPMPVRQAIKTLLEICKHQNHKTFVEILENAHAQYVLFDCDNWNDVTSTFRLHLGLATSVFAVHQPKIDEFEKNILEISQFQQAIRK